MILFDRQVVLVLPCYGNVELRVSQGDISAGDTVSFYGVEEL